MSAYNKHATKDPKRQKCSQFLKSEIAKEVDPDAHLANFGSDEPWKGLDNAIIEFGPSEDVLDENDCVEELYFD